MLLHDAPQAVTAEIARSAMRHDRRHKDRARIGFSGSDGFVSSRPGLQLPATTPHADSVTWVRIGFMHHQARCTCAWVGPRRVVFRSLASVNGLLHAAQNRCLPAAPLLRPRLRGSAPRGAREPKTYAPRQDRSCTAWR
jgi:hypothetical protein